jgi:hypothetical protein
MNLKRPCHVVDAAISLEEVSRCESVSIDLVALIRPALIVERLVQRVRSAHRIRCAAKKRGEQYQEWETLHSVSFLETARSSFTGCRRLVAAVIGFKYELGFSSSTQLTR